MPSRLPVTDVVKGFAKVTKVFLRFWLHYMIVIVAWLGVVPLTACTKTP